MNKSMGYSSFFIIKIDSTTISTNKLVRSGESLVEIDVLAIFASITLSIESRGVLKVSKKARHSFLASSIPSVRILG